MICYIGQFNSVLRAASSLTWVFPDSFRNNSVWQWLASCVTTVANGSTAVSQRRATEVTAYAPELLLEDENLVLNVSKRIANLVSTIVRVLL